VRGPSTEAVASTACKDCESGVSKNSYWIAQMTEGTCQYCGKLTTLIEAHIVPRAFYPPGSIQVLSIDTPRTRRYLAPSFADSTNRQGS
jgi:hypothetical protein